jgi:hypothetical protein
MSLFQDKEQEKWMLKAMFRAKYPDIAKLMDQVRKYFPGAKLVKLHIKDMIKRKPKRRR